MSISGEFTMFLLSEEGCFKWFMHPVIRTHSSITTQLTRVFINCIYVLFILFDDNISKMATAPYPDSRVLSKTDQITSHSQNNRDFYPDWMKSLPENKVNPKWNFCMIGTISQVLACMSSWNQSHKMVMMIVTSTSPTSKTVQNLTDGSIVQSCSFLLPTFAGRQ